MLSNCRNLRVISFRGLFQNGRAEAICSHASRTYVIQNKCAYPNTMPKNFLILSGSNPVRECIRFKSKGRNKDSRRQEYESDSDEEENDMNFDEDGRPLMVKKSLLSMRLDNILMKIFGLSRRKTEELLMANYVYVNDAVAIKSLEIKAEDIVEIKELLDSSSSAKGSTKKVEIVKIKPDFVSQTFDVAYIVH